MPPELIVELTHGINDYLARVRCWLDEHNLQFNDKSTYTIFPTWTKEINQELNIEMNKYKIAQEKTPKTLGFLLYPTLFKYIY